MQVIVGKVAVEAIVKAFGSHPMPEYREKLRHLREPDCDCDSVTVPYDAIKDWSALITDKGNVDLIDGQEFISLLT